MSQIDDLRDIAALAWVSGHDDYEQRILDAANTIQHMRAALSKSYTWLVGLSGFITTSQVYKELLAEIEELVLGDDSEPS